MASFTNEDWQCDKTLPQCMAVMLEKQIMCDVTFLMGEEGHEVKAHKYILVSRSPVFQAMLDGVMAERGKIKVDDIDKETFQVFLRYLYTDDVFLTEENVIEVLYVSKKYCVDLLTKKCKEFLRLNISVYNACLLMDVDHGPIDEEIHKNCLQKIKDNIETCLASSWFKSIGTKCLKAITELEDVSIKEEFLFEQIMKWCDAECERQHLEVTWENKRKVLGITIYNIRFSLMNASYFAKEISKISLLTSEEKIATLQSKEENDVAFGQSQTPSTTYQFHVKKRCVYERVVRFPSHAGPWRADGIPDCILFRTTDYCNLHGILVYGCYDTPCRYSIDVMIKEGRSEILTEFSTTIESVPEVMMHEVKFYPKIPIRAYEVYTIKIVMKGSPSKAGSNGHKKVPLGNDVQVHFFYANNCNLGTNQEHGQIPGLLLRGTPICRQRYRYYDNFPYNIHRFLKPE